MLKLSITGTSANDQTQADRLIVDFIIQTMSPQALVEHKAFKDLITGISRIKAPITVMTRKTLSKRINNDYSSLVQAMIQEIQSVKYTTIIV